MKVTANTLLNYIRCRRFASLNDPESEVAHKSYDISSKAFYQAFFQQFEKEYINQKNNIQTGGMESYDFHPDVELFETFDFMETFENKTILYHLIPSTSNEFLRMRYNEDKHKYQLFTKTDQGIYTIRSVDLDQKNKHLQEKLQKLMTRTNDLGRAVYRSLFKRYVYEISTGSLDALVYTVLLDTNYVYDGLKYNKNLFHIVDFNALYPKMKEIFEADVYRMINHLELEDFTACPLVKKECRKGDTFECKFTGFCFSHIPKKNSILDYFNSHLGFDEPSPEGDIHHDTYELINEGYVDMHDVPISWLKDEKHLMQRYCVETDYVHVHQAKIEAGLKTLQFPLIYLDFEALPCLLPRFRGETPFTQSVFQYSIHIQKNEHELDKNGKDHYEFLANPTYDNRLELTKSMIQIINQYDSSVIVYNKTFEEQRLKELQLVFPELKNDLQRIIDRLFDLMDIVKNNKKFYLELGFTDDEASRYNFYSAGLSGSYSLKKVIEVFHKDAYTSLNIQNGVAAYNAFMGMESQPPTDRDNTAKDLLEYCKQDTYSMFEIIEGLYPYLSPGFQIR
ncbi:MAG: DUF2779 domain-containing protein [Bacilli bacterium]|nr:DUF2779 domain-containing protein [Bacilli bacterium]MBN2877501.1 DUF2779 domain-containing protein [Bacilli bacterium]